MPAAHTLPLTLGDLRTSSHFAEACLKTRSVKDELRRNLIARLRDSRAACSPASSALTTPSFRKSSTRFSPAELHPARPARTGQKPHPARPHHLLDAHLPYIAGCEIRDNPTRPSASAAAIWSPSSGDATPIAWLTRDDRYVEKLATPDVTVADLIGDLDPIKAARGGQDFGQRTHHALRPAAPRQPRHLRHQRAARPRRKNPGRAVQHHAGRRCPDQRLPRPPATRRRARLQRQS
jgi:magnesium chelatase subunit I